MKLPILPKNITLREKQPRKTTQWDCLSPRERQVVELLIQDNTHSQISKRLGINQHTVLKHVMNIKVKLGLKGPVAPGLKALGIGEQLKTDKSE